MNHRKDNWIDHLQTRFPWFPKEVYCGPGWARLIESLCDKIQVYLDAHPDYRAEFYVTQCKEKYGHLMFYAFPENAEIEQLIEEADIEAMGTCESCGSPGSVGSTEIDGVGIWLTVRCQKCLTESGLES